MKILKSAFFNKKSVDYDKPLNVHRRDTSILYTAYFLLSFGMITVVSASYGACKVYSLSAMHFALKHFVFCILALFIMHIFSKQRNNLKIIGVVFWWASVIALIAVFFLGSSAKGARRWISLFGFSFQPSEFAKIGVILEGARFSNNLSRFFVVYFIPILLILLEPDLGTAFIILAIGIAQLMVKRFNFRYFAISIALSVVLVFLAYFLFEHVRLRIDAFFSVSDILGKGYQKYKSYLAMKNGGLFGTGFGKGSIKDFLPDAHTDFIFSVIIEEFGVLGGLMIIFAFINIALRSLKLQPSNDYLKMIHYSSLISILMQAWLNIASALSLIPTKGLTLPFVSYGGSGLIVQGVFFGILLATNDPYLHFSSKKIHQKDQPK
jgi:cell division protein FtsW